MQGNKIVDTCMSQHSKTCMLGKKNTLIASYQSLNQKQHTKYQLSFVLYHLEVASHFGDVSIALNNAMYIT